MEYVAVRFMARISEDVSQPRRNIEDTSEGKVEARPTMVKRFIVLVELKNVSFAQGLELPACPT